MIYFLNLKSSLHVLGLVAGVQLRRGTRDDMACQGPSTSAKVRRHASVVLLRHSLIETTPLTVWGPEQQGMLTLIHNLCFFTECRVVYIFLCL